MKKLVINCHGGIGNIINSLLSARHLALKYGTQLVVYWGSERIQHYNELFREVLPVVECNEFSSISRAYAYFTESRLHPGASILHRMVSGPLFHVLPENFTEYDIVVATQGHQLLTDGDRSAEFRNIVYAQLENMLNIEILRTRDARIDQIDPATCIGAHVRRGDLLNLKCDQKSRLVTDAAYFNELDSCDSRIFLSTDCASTRDKWRAKYGGRLISYDSSNTADDCVDLLLLAECGKIIAADSTFSDTAAVIGSTEITVLRSGVDDIINDFFPNTSEELVWRDISQIYHDSRPANRTYRLKRLSDGFYWKHDHGCKWYGPFDTGDEACKDWRIIDSN